MKSSIFARDIFEVEDGILKSVDLSRLLFPDPSDPIPDVHLVKVQRRPTDPSALPKLSRWPAAPGQLALTKAEKLQLRPVRSGTKPGPLPSIQPLPRTTYSVQRSRRSSFLGGLLTGAVENQGRVQIELPIGMPRFVSAATLKEMFGADGEETLFGRVGKRWEVCPDSEEVDLRDRTKVFRLGKVEIYS